jgi:hypothetical protein
MIPAGIPPAISPICALERKERERERLSNQDVSTSFCYQKGTSSIYYMIQETYIHRTIETGRLVLEIYRERNTNDLGGRFDVVGDADLSIRGAKETTTTFLKNGLYHLETGILPSIITDCDGELYHSCGFAWKVDIR